MSAEGAACRVQIHSSAPATRVTAAVPGQLQFAAATAVVAAAAEATAAIAVVRCGFRRFTQELFSAMRKLLGR